MTAAKLLAPVFLAALVTLAAVPAGADLIYDNGGPLAEGTGNEATTWLQAEDVLFAAGSRIAGAGVYVAFLDGVIPQSPPPVEYFFFGDASGAPGPLLASGRGTVTAFADTGVPWCCGGDAWLLEFVLDSAFAAAAGTPYWFGIHLADGYVDRGDVYWVTTAPNGTAPGQESELGTMDNWQTTGEEHAFFLTGRAVAVAEPEIWPLLAAGLLVLAGILPKGR